MSFKVERRTPSGSEWLKVHYYHSYNQAEKRALKDAPANPTCHYRVCHATYLPMWRGNDKQKWQVGTGTGFSGQNMALDEARARARGMPRDQRVGYNDQMDADCQQTLVPMLLVKCEVQNGEPVVTKHRWRKEFDLDVPDGPILCEAAAEAHLMSEARARLGDTLQKAKDAWDGPVQASVHECYANRSAELSLRNNPEPTQWFIQYCRCGKRRIVEIDIKRGDRVETTRWHNRREAHDDSDSEARP